MCIRDRAKAEAQGFKVYTAAEAAKQADIIMILINDELQADMYLSLIHICMKYAFVKVLKLQFTY